MKSDPKYGMHHDAYRIVVALPEREELMSSRVDRGELPARSRKSVQQAAIAPLGSSEIRKVVDNGLVLTFGNHVGHGGESFWGAFDELRLRGGAVDASWIAAEYATATSATFVSASAAMPASSGLMLILR